MINTKKLKIVDVDKCMSEENLIGSVSRHFEQAEQMLSIPIF